jgi:restriction system-associated AAA family ATPase
MKLLKLKTNNPFRGLPNKGIELNFRQNLYMPTDINEPICLVGLNGTGKSNVLELICEIFYYLEVQHIANEKELKLVNDRYADINFEISYSITKLKWQAAKSKFVNTTIDVENDDVIIDIKKSKNKAIEIKVISVDSNKQFDLDLHLLPEILPNKIIGYSSGQNELISNPFIKLDYHYFDAFEKRKGDKNVLGNLDINRMFFMDYDSSQLVVLANFLFQENNMSNWKERQEFNKKLKIEHLHSFSLKIQFKDYKKDEIVFLSELNVGIEKLKKCATVWNDNENELLPKARKNRIIEMSFYTDAAVRKAFRNIFRTPIELFRILYLLRLLNIYCYSNTTRASIKNAEKGTNLNNLIPKPATDDLVFKIDAIMFKKINIDAPIAYKQLSDGEHQLLHTIGTLMLMQEPDSLFILDEPETHFNPEWRAKLISLIMRNNVDNRNNQDYFITSHSPFIISDCKPENVFIFNKNNGVLKIETAAQKKLNTFGTSVNSITEEVFDKNESQGDYSLKVLNEIKQRSFKNLEDIQKAKEDARQFGQSVEKTLLFRKLLMLENEIKNASKIKRK